jgi:mono/diheme cytochrome c family protein
MRTSAILVLTAVLGGGGPVRAQDIGVWKDEYVRYCASCHGLTGKGDGPVAAILKTPPTDLSRLSAANNGVFPVTRVYEIIDGRANVTAHGSRDMPVWGNMYRSQLTYPGSPVTPENMESLIRVRILGLIEYLQTLQGK